MERASNLNSADSAADTNVTNGVDAVCVSKNVNSASAGDGAE